ncbi:translation initiation factor IF-1, chloroplastic [Arachis duranensis]|uniref:Translation initiation factor IF-1, chloroplastic n=1 Tax=Arachis duranensis TaxID=130453 RepID=A0A6P4DQH1_ARADU|nr:translation initiation factor IF-1, chloroplastic [Arachis duranensis]
MLTSSPSSSSSSCFSLNTTPILRHHHHHTLTLSLPPSPVTLTLHHRITPSFLRPSSFPPAPAPANLLVPHAKPPTADKSGEQKWVHEGLITESLPNGMFRVRLDNQDLILGYVSGKIRKNFVRILPGDRVKVEVSRYDSSKGRIVYRLRSSSSS